MVLTVHISESIRSVVKDLPKTVVVEKPASSTIRQLAIDIGIPPILIVFAMVDDVKKSLDEVIAGDAKIHFFGTIAGG
jgi:hypothetical protein